MARLLKKDDNGDMETGTIGGLSNFNFSSVRVERLGAAEYTVVTIAVDTSSSLGGFESELRDMLLTTVESCRKSPRSNNLLLRTILFSSSYPGGVQELHGFKPLDEIDAATDYPPISTSGMTPLNDAAYSGIGATCEFAKRLMDDDFLANGIVFVITDGYENASTSTASMSKQLVEDTLKSEGIESLVSVLIGINASQYNTELEAFKKSAGITQRIDAGDVTKGKLAKLAVFVSQSVSSQSQALGTGGASQQISATI